MKSNIVRKAAVESVSFHGDEIQAVRDGDRVWVVLKRACEVLGIDANAQKQRLQDSARSPWATTCVTHATGTDGKRYGMFCIDLDSLPIWLATIEAARVRPEARDKLIAYQRECARVLRDHFFSAPTPSPAIHILLAENPCDWDPMFDRMVVEGFCRIHGKPVPSAGSQPQWLSSSYAKLYRIILGDEEYAWLKAHNGEPRFGSNHHQYLRPGPRDRFRRELKTVVGFLRASLATPRPVKHFWELMRFHYGLNDSIQMWMPIQ